MSAVVCAHLYYSFRMENDFRNPHLISALREAINISRFYCFDWKLKAKIKNKKRNSNYNSSNSGAEFYKFKSTMADGAAIVSKIKPSNSIVKEMDCIYQP